MIVNADFLRRYITKVIVNIGEIFKIYRSTMKFTEETIVYFTHYLHTLNEFE